MTAARRLFRIAARVCLGLFVVGQLLLLLLANFVPMLQKARPHLAEHETVRQVAPAWAERRGTAYEATETLATWTARWTELTCQPQSWSLFAPEVAHSITFVAVELRWDDGNATPPLLSENEPPDRHQFFRVGRFRIRRYESALDLLLTTVADKQAEEMKDTWHFWIEDKVTENWRRMLAYLRLRTRTYLAAHPDLPPPRQVIFTVRRYDIPDPGEQPWNWQGPFVSKVARWRPGAVVAEEYLPVEAYNPLLEQFEPVKR